jgi:hypothetical protein
MSVTVGPNGTSSFHRDPQMAMKTIEIGEGEDVRKGGDCSGCVGARCGIGREDAGVSRT